MSNRKSAVGLGASSRKREKPSYLDEDSNSKLKEDNSEQFLAEHELFIQAFEKPTQIYRALRTRNLISPIFLQRTLTFMKHRSNIRTTGRKSFRVDSLLERTEKKIKDSNHKHGDYLSITFLGYYEKKSSTCPEGSLPVELLLLKPVHNRRKDSYVQESLGTVDVPVNPSEEFPPSKAPVLCIPTNSLNPLYGHQVQQSLLFRILQCEKDKTPDTTPSENNQEPFSKKRRTSHIKDENSDENSTNISNSNAGPTLSLCSVLQVYNRNFRCLLEEGDYSSILMKTDLKSLSSSGSKNRSWEASENYEQKFEMNEHSPYIKFRLAWTQNVSGPMVDRPKPLKPRGMNHQQNGIHVTSQNNDDKKKDNKRSKSLNTSSKPNPQKIIYQFLYNNNSRQQTEAREDLHCPWCALDCQELYPLLKHLKLSHPRFLFTYVPMTEGARIDVSVSELYDSTYVGNPHDLINQPPGAAFSRFGPVQRTPITNILVCKPKRPKPSLSEFLEMEENDLNGPYDGQRPFVTGHNRLYHYSTTSLPMLPHAILQDHSDDVVDPNWLTATMCQMIDEFSDVNEGEKELMKMWNLHVQHYTFVGDCQIPLALKMFIDEHGKELIEKNLYKNFLLHLTNLFEFGILSPVDVFTAILQFQQFIADNNLMLKWKDQHLNWQESKKLTETPIRKDFSGLFSSESTHG